MGKSKVSADVKNISPVMKEAVKEWLNEVTAALSENKEPSLSVEALGEKVIKALMKEHKGKGPKAVKQAFNELKPQLEFVTLLIFGVNDEVNSKQREMGLEVELLIERFQRIVTVMASDEAATIAVSSVREMPYPLSKEMADLFLSLNKRAVKSWNQLEKGILPYMLEEHFISEGRKKIPDQWLRSMYSSNLSEDELDKTLKERIKEAHSAFESPEAFDDFLKRKDFNHGFADVRDEEFDRAAETLAKAIKSLLDADILKKGNILRPNDPPNYFMANIPLIEEKWIDKEALELLDCYKTILNMGYEIIHLEDNPLAWPIMFEPEDEGEGGEEEEEEDEGVTEEELSEGEEEEGEEEEEEEEESKFLDKVEQYTIFLESKERLSSLNLEERVIDGRVHVSIDDYLRREGQFFGEEDFEIEEGITVESWNSWIEENKSYETGMAKLAGFNVLGIADEIGPEDIHEVGSLQETMRLQELREGINLAMERIRLSTPAVPPSLEEKGAQDGWYIRTPIAYDGSARELIATWRNMALDAIMNYAGMRRAINSLAEDFFDGTNFLLEDMLETLDLVIGRIIGIINAYNDVITKRLDLLRLLGIITWTEDPPYGWGALFPRGFSIDLDEVADAVEEYALAHRKRFIDMAQPKSQASSS